MQKKLALQKIIDTVARASFREAWKDAIAIDVAALFKEKTMHKDLKVGLRADEFRKQVNASLEMDGDAQTKVYINHGGTRQEYWYNVSDVKFDEEENVLVIVTHHMQMEDE